MSVTGSGDGNVIYTIRVDQGWIDTDMAAARAKISTEVAKTMAGLDAASAAARSSRSKYTEEEAAKLHAAFGAETKAKFTSLKEEIFGTTKAADTLTTSVGNLSDQASGIDRLTAGMLKFGAAMVIAESVGRALGGVVDAIDLGKAIASGDREAVEGSKAKIKGGVEALPAVGTLSKNLGRFQDAVPGLGTLRKGVAWTFGTQTDEEIKEFDRQQAELKKTLDANESLIKQGAQQQRESAAVTQAAQREAARAGKTTTEVGVLNAQNRLDDFKKKIADRPVTGKGLSADDKEAIAELEKGVKRAKDDDITAKSNDARQAREQLQADISTVIEKGRGFFSDLGQHVVATTEAAIRGQAELRAAELETAGKVDEAETARFEESVRRRINDAQKVGDYQVGIVEAIAEEERKQLAKTQEERRAAKDREAQRDIERSTDESDRVMHAIADQEKQRARTIEDLEASAEDKRLRRSGQGAQADVNAILRGASRDLADAGEDAGLGEAIMANAREELLSIKPDQSQRAQVAEAVSAQAAGMLNLMGGDPKQDELTSIQQQALDALKDISKKVGPARVGP